MQTKTHTKLCFESLRLSYSQSVTGAEDSDVTGVVNEGGGNVLPPPPLNSTHTSLLHLCSASSSCLFTFFPYLSSFATTFITLHSIDSMASLFLYKDATGVWWVSGLMNVLPFLRIVWVLRINYLFKIKVTVLVKWYATRHFLQNLKIEPYLKNRLFSKVCKIYRVSV